MVKKGELPNGDDLLYRFFQQVLADEPELMARVPHLLATTMGVWLPVDVYREFPVLLPWVVRDPDCRGRKAKDGTTLRKDEWSAPNEGGYLRDDNSLVKGLKQSLTVSSRRSTYLDGHRLGTRFVAAHIWREVDDPKLATRLPLLNSFVPNLVWLPAQVAKLSDHEASVVQEALKSVSWAIYRHQEVEPGLRPVVDEAWALLPAPAPISEITLEELNWFVTTPTFLALRRRRLKTVIGALEALERGSLPTGKIIASRYTAGLPKVSEAARSGLLGFLRQFDLEPA